MVKYQQPALDRTFAALSDSTRRALLARLGDKENMSVSELARPFSMSLPAVMKHLDVLSDAGLITRSKTGRTVSCRLKAAPMENAMNWLVRYQRYAVRRTGSLAIEREDSHNPYTRVPEADHQRTSSTRTDLRKLSAWIKLMRSLEEAKKRRDEE